MNQPPPTLVDQRLGALLQRSGKVSEADVAKALAFQAQAGRGPNNRLGAILLRIGALSEDSLLPVLAEQSGLAVYEPSGTLSAGAITDALALLAVPRSWWLARDAVPFAFDTSSDDTPQRIGIACRDPLDLELLETLQSAPSGATVQRMWAKRVDLDRLLSIMREDPSAKKYAGANSADYLRELAEGAPVIEFVNNVMAQAVDERASDIHIEPGERTFEVRFRVDGVLSTRMSRPREGFEAVASRVKLTSGLDIAERRLPQDGRVTTRVSGVELDLRVSSIPGVHGESLVLRLLPKERADLSLASLGMAPDHLGAFNRLLAQPNGIILVTGPTGSGKSTTLYSALHAINDRTLKIVTVEDPVEYRMSGITQIQTHAEIGYTFARALRSILRHDPDVIMIGEIRDAETAEIAIQSALTGHLVLATIHTNDAPSAFTRLLEMGIEPFLLATSVRGVLAQRLVRKLDPSASKPVDSSGWLTDELDMLRATYPDAFPKSVELRVAAETTPNSTGYRGRGGIYELLTVTPEVQDAIVRRAGAGEIAEIARKAPGAYRFRTLREDGLLKAASGVTSVEEVLRVAGSQSSGVGADDAMIAEAGAK